MINVSTHRHFDTPCQCLEDAFYLMMFVSAFSPDMKIHPCGVAQTLEEVEEHLCGYVTDAFAAELYIPYQPGSATKV